MTRGQTPTKLGLRTTLRSGFREHRLGRRCPYVLFSTAEIHAAIDRNHRLQRASTADFTKFKPRKFHAQAA